MSNKSDSVWTLSFRMAVASVISKVIKWFCIGTLIVVGIFFIIDYTTSDITDKYVDDLLPYEGAADNWIYWAAGNR